MVIPFGNDQYAWGQRAFDLGVGSKPIPIGKLTSDNLSETLLFALSKEIVSNAKELGKKIRTETGATDAAKVVIPCLQSLENG